MILNPFSSDAFEMAALTAAINKIPNTYGRLERLNLMPPQGVRTRTIIIEERGGVLNLPPTQPVGAPGTVGITGKRKVRSFVIPHIPHDDTVLPEEVQGIRAFGSETETDAIANLMALKLQDMRNKHAITLEYLRMGALKGEFMTGILCLCSQGFFDALTTHAKVKEAYARWREGQVLFTDNRTAFTFGGGEVEEYRGQATDAAGNV